MGNMQALQSLQLLFFWLEEYQAAWKISSHIELSNSAVEFDCFSYGNNGAVTSNGEAKTTPYGGSWLRVVL